MSNNGFHFKKNTARKSMPVNPAYYEGHHTTVILGDEQRFNSFSYNNSHNFSYNNGNFNTHLNNMNGQILNDFVPSSGFPVKKPLLGDRPRSLGPNFRSYSVDGMANNFGQSNEFFENPAVPSYNRKNQFRSESPDDLPKLFKSPRKRAYENRHNFTSKKSCVQERVFDRGIKRQLSQSSATSGSDSNDNFNEIFGPDGIDRFDHQQNGAKAANKNNLKQPDFKRARWEDNQSSGRSREDDHRKDGPRKKDRRSRNGSRRFHDRLDNVRHDRHHSSRSPSSENSSVSSSDLSKKNRDKRSPDRERLFGDEAKDRKQSMRKDSYSESRKIESRHRPSEKDRHRHKDILGKSRKKEGLHKSTKHVVSENENPKGKVLVEHEKSKNTSESDKSNINNRSDKADSNTNKVNSVLKSVALNSDERKSVTNSNKPASITLNSNKSDSVTPNSNKAESVTPVSNKTESVILNYNKPESVTLNSKKPESVTLNSNEPESVTLNSNKLETINLNSNKYESTSRKHESASPNSNKRESLIFNSEKHELLSENSCEKIAKEYLKADSSDNTNKKTDGILQKQKSLENKNSKSSSDTNKSQTLPKPVLSENSSAKHEQKSRNLFDLSFLSDKLKSPELKSLKRDIHRSSSEDKISENFKEKEKPSSLSKKMFNICESKEDENEIQQNDDITMANEGNSKNSINEGASKGSRNMATITKNLDRKERNGTNSNSEKSTLSKDEPKARKDMLSSKRTLSVEAEDQLVKTPTKSTLESSSKSSLESSDSSFKSKLDSSLKSMLESSSKSSFESSSKSSLESSSKSTLDSVKRGSSDTVKLCCSKEVSDSSKSVKETPKTVSKSENKSQSVDNKSKSASVSECRKSGQRESNSETSKHKILSDTTNSEKTLSSSPSTSFSSSKKLDISKASVLSKSDKPPSKMTSNKESKDLSKGEKHSPKPSNGTKSDTTKSGTVSSKHLCTKKSQRPVKLTSQSEVVKSLSVSKLDKVLSKPNEGEKRRTLSVSKIEKSSSKNFHSADFSRTVQEDSNSIRMHETQKSKAYSKEQKELEKPEPSGSTPTYLKSTDNVRSKSENLKMCELKSESSKDVGSYEECVAKLSPGDIKLKKKNHSSCKKSLQSSSLKSLKTSQKSSHLLSVTSKLKYNSNKNRLKCEKRQNMPKVLALSKDPHRDSGVPPSKDPHHESGVPSSKDPHCEPGISPSKDVYNEVSCTENFISKETQENPENNNSVGSGEKNKKRHKSEEQQCGKEKKRTRHKSEKTLSNFDITSQNFSTSGKTLKLPLSLGNTRSSRTDDIEESSQGSGGEVNKEPTGDNDQMTALSPISVSVITYGGVKSLSPCKGSKHSELTSEGVVTSIMNNEKYVPGNDQDKTDKNRIKGNMFYQSEICDVSSEDDETITNGRDVDMETEFDKQEGLENNVEKQINQKGGETSGEKAKNMDDTGSTEEMCCESGGSTPLQDERSDYDINECLFPNKKSNGDLRLHVLVKKEPIDYDFVNIKKEPVEMEFDLNHKIKVEKDYDYRTQNSNVRKNHVNINSEGINKNVPDRAQRSVDNNTPESISSTEDSTSEEHENNQKDNIEMGKKVNNNDSNEERDNSGNLVIDFDNNSNSNVIETPRTEACNHGKQEEEENSDLEKDSDLEENFDVPKNSLRPETPNFSNLNEILGINPKMHKVNLSEENPTNSESITLKETSRNDNEMANLEKESRKDVLEKDGDCNVKDGELSEDLVAENSVLESEGRDNTSLDETIAYCQSSEGDETVVEPASLVNDKVVEHCDKKDKNHSHSMDKVSDGSNITELKEKAEKDSNKMETTSSSEISGTEVESCGYKSNIEVLASQREMVCQSLRGEKNTNEKDESMDVNLSASLVDTDMDEMIQDASYSSDDLLQDEIDDDDVRVMVYVKGVPQSPWTPAPAKHELSEEEDEFDELMKKKDHLTCDSNNETSSNRIPSSLPCSPELTDINFESLSKGTNSSHRGVSGDSGASDSAYHLKSTDVSKNSQNQEEEDHRSTESRESSSKSFYVAPLVSGSASLETQIQNLDVMLKSLSESLAESNNPMNKAMFESLSTFSKNFSGLKSKQNNDTEDKTSAIGNTKTAELDNAISSNSRNNACDIRNTQNTNQKNNTSEVMDLVNKLQPNTNGDKCISLASGNVEELHIASSSRTMNVTKTNNGNIIGDKESNSASVPRLVTMPGDSTPNYNDITRDRHNSGSLKTQHPNFSSSNILHPNFTSSNAQQTNFVSANSQPSNFVSANSQQPNFVNANLQQQNLNSSNAQQPENLSKNKAVGNVSRFSELSPNPANRHQRSRTLPDTYVSPEMQQQYQQAALKLNLLTDSRNMKNTVYPSQSNTLTNQINPQSVYSGIQQRQVPRSVSDYQNKQNPWMGNDLSTDSNNFSTQTTPVDMNIRFTHIKTVIIQDTIRTINSVGSVLPMLYSDDLRRCVQCYTCKNFFSPLQFKMHMDGELNNKVHLESLNAEFIPTRKLNQQEIIEWDKFLQIFNAEVRKRSVGANQSQRQHHSPLNTQTQCNPSQIPGSSTGPASRNVRRHTVSQPVSNTNHQPMNHYSATQAAPPSSVLKDSVDPMTFDQHNRKISMQSDSRQSRFVVNPQSNQNMNRQNMPPSLVDPASYQSSVSAGHSNYGMPNSKRMQPSLSNNQTSQKNSTSSYFTESQHLHVQSASPAQNQTSRLSPSFPETSQSSGPSNMTPAEDTPHNLNHNTDSSASSTATSDIPTDNSNHSGSSPARSQHAHVSPNTNQRSSPGTSGSDSQNNIFRRDNSGGIQLNVQTPSDIIRAFRIAQNIQMECMTSMATYMGQLEETVNRLEKDLHLASLKNKESEDTLEKFGKKIKDLYKQLNGSDNDT